MGRVVDDGLQQIAIARDSIALVIVVDVVAFLRCLIEGVVGVAFPDLIDKMKYLKYISILNDSISKFGSLLLTISSLQSKKWLHRSLLSWTRYRPMPDFSSQNCLIVSSNLTLRACICVLFVKNPLASVRIAEK